MRAHAGPDGCERYERRFEEARLPQARHPRCAQETIGRDGHRLLSALEADAPVWLRHAPAVETLRPVGVQPFPVVAGVLRWRKGGNLPPAAHMIYSPYDVEARYSKKRDTEWKGYQAHLTECCGPALPLVIPDVPTTPAPTTDCVEALPKGQAALAGRELLPEEPLVDSGYRSAAHRVAGQQNDTVALLKPVLPDPSWQSKTADAFDVSTFAVDWENRVACCPQGQTSVSGVES